MFDRTAAEQALRDIEMTAGGTEAASTRPPRVTRWTVMAPAGLAAALTARPHAIGNPLPPGGDQFQLPRPARQPVDDCRQADARQQVLHAQVRVQMGDQVFALVGGRHR